MYKYVMTYEGIVRFRRVEIRMHSDPSAGTENYNILHYIHEHGAATTDEIIRYMGLTRKDVANRLFFLMNRGYIEASAEN